MMRSLYNTDLMISMSYGMISYNVLTSEITIAHLFSHGLCLFNFQERRKPRLVVAFVSHVSERFSRKITESSNE